MTNPVSQSPTLGDNDLPICISVHVIPVSVATRVPSSRKMEHQPRMPDAAERVGIYLGLTFSNVQPRAPATIYGVSCIWSVAGAIETTLQEPGHDFAGASAIISRDVSPGIHHSLGASHSWGTLLRISCPLRATWHWRNMLLVQRAATGRSCRLNGWQFDSIIRSMRLARVNKEV